MRHKQLLHASLAALLLAACGGVDSNDDDGNDDADAGQVDAPTPDAPLQVAEAPADNDSLANPAISVFLSITGNRNFTHADEVSAPTGDATDFAEFEFPNNANPAQIVRITLDCTLTGQSDAIAAATIYEDGVATNQFVDCNTGEQTLTVDNTKIQVAEIGFRSVAEATHIDYTLTVVGFQ